MLEETAGARRDLEERLGTAIKHFAYPDGAFSAETVRGGGAGGLPLRVHDAATTATGAIRC